ncbi:MAG: hypothetical protein WC263_01105 [Candidatus Micrarchaeia archaeon]
MAILRGQGATQLRCGATYGTRRGQGATEYLVLLAVVLIVALVSVALLGFFPGMASDARMTQSQSYWRGQARPFSIQEAVVAGSIGNFSIQNMESNGPYTITAIYIGNNTVITTNSSMSFSAGETKIVVATEGLPTVCTPGSIYDYSVNITYTTPSGISGARQYGTKNLIGRCL